MSTVSFGEAIDRLHSRPGHTQDEWNDAAGQFLHNMLGGTPEPGPPYTHTLTGPRPVLARNGKPLYWHPVRP